MSKKVDYSKPIQAVTSEGVVEASVVAANFNEDGNEWFVTIEGQADQCVDDFGIPLEESGSLYIQNIPIQTGPGSCNSVNVLRSNVDWEKPLLVCRIGRQPVEGSLRTRFPDDDGEKSKTTFVVWWKESWNSESTSCVSHFKSDGKLINGSAEVWIINKPEPKAINWDGKLEVYGEQLTRPRRAQYHGWRECKVHGCVHVVSYEDAETIESEVFFPDGTSVFGFEVYVRNR